MASLIKNQIIKRLSKFVKNLSSNQINLSALKGEGELSSIDLDEQALEDVIELPTWLKIQKATCGRVFIKIPWTSLKTLPIQIQLDDVAIQIETCETLRDLRSPTDTSNANDPLMGKYGFTNRVIDGISLTINNLTFDIKAQGFKASICVPALEIYSITPYGKRVDTLRLTRLCNATKEHILLFKEISWPNARIEASANDNNMAAAAIRLIVNACRIRISMKKNLQDSTMITSRVMIHFDDLLSVFNDAQLKSFLNTYKEIATLMKRSSEQRKRKAGEKLTKSEQQPSSFQSKPPASGNSDPMNSSSSFNTQQQVNDPFRYYDVVETSIHFNIKRFDIHITAESEILSDREAQTGALQMTLANLSMDHYPYHEFGSSKTHWVKYSEMLALNRDEWVRKIRDEWNEQLKFAKSNAPNDETSAQLEKALRTNRIRLYESCTVMNIDDLVLYPVTLNSSSGRYQEQKRRRPLITSDRTEYQLPEFLGVINIQFTEYYYPFPYAFPVPNSDLYIQIMPTVMRMDFATSSWLDAFISSLSMTINDSGVMKNSKSNTDLEHVAIKIEAMLPRIVLSSDMFSDAYQSEIAKNESKSTSGLLERKETSNEDKLEILELNVSKVLLTNCRTESTSNRNKLEQHLELFRKTNFFQQNQWPLADDLSDSSRISPLFDKHPYEAYLYSNPLTRKMGLTLPESQSANAALHSFYTMTTDSLKKCAKYDIWHFNADSVYVDFTPASPTRNVRLAKQNMTDSFSISAWAVVDEKQQVDSSTTLPWANMLCILEAPTIFKISQKQYTFSMHLVDEFGLFLDVIERNRVQSRLIKEKLQKHSTSTSKSIKDFKFNVFLLSPSTFTLAVIDGLDNALVNLAKPTSLPSTTEAEIELAMRDTANSNVVFDLVSTPTATSGSTPRFDSLSLSSSLINVNEDSKSSSSSLNRSCNSSGQKKTKAEDNLQRGLETTSKGSRGSSQASLANMNDNIDESSAQWDQLSEDLDADIDPALLNSEYEKQQQQQPKKAARIEIEDDFVSLGGKNDTNKIVIGTNALESVNGVFIKLNEIKVYVDQDEGKPNRPIYVACSLKDLRIDEFQSLKYDAIKPKLFENEFSSDLNNGDYPAINTRIDFPKNKSPPLPMITVKLADRTLGIPTHGIDVLVQNFKQVRTNEEKRARKQRPSKIIPFDIQIKNFQLSLEETPTAQTVGETKPIKLQIQRMHILRQLDGQIMIQIPENEDKSTKSISSKSNSDSVDVDEKLRQADMIRLENERLRAELNAHKKEITVLRGERDSLMNTISKLDIELTQAEHQRMVQQQQKPRKR